MNADNRVQLEMFRLREDAKARARSLVAAWRRDHPEATCSDDVALALAELAASVGRAVKDGW